MYLQPLCPFDVYFVLQNLDIHVILCECVCVLGTAQLPTQRQSGQFDCQGYSHHITVTLLM